MIIEFNLCLKTGKNRQFKSDRPRKHMAPLRNAATAAAMRVCWTARFQWPPQCFGQFSSFCR